MPTFTIKSVITNNSGVPVKVHVGASLVGVSDNVEYFNEADDITVTLATGSNTITRYLTSYLGSCQKYDLVVALWEAEQPIGTGIKYVDITLHNAVEKKKKKPVKLAISIQYFSPGVFTEE